MDVVRVEWVRVRKFNDPEPTYTILDVPSIKPKIPQPTEHSLVLSTADFRNIISITPAKLPLLVTDSISGETAKFIDEYRPDYIYTLGFSIGLNNSYEITHDEIPRLFFPNATQAVYAESREKAILGSNLAYYLGVPVVFEQTSKYELTNLENMTIDEIQALYVSKLKEKGDNTNYLVLANPDSDEGLLAGFVAGMRRGYIVPVHPGDDVSSILEKINSTVSFLGSEKLFAASLEYKKGVPLYLVILGGNGSVPFYYFPDPGFENADNKDGNTLHSDFVYGDVYNDGWMDLGVGRLEGGPASVSLGLARQRLPVGNKAVLVGEYRHGKFADLLNAFGGMSQAFIIDEMILDKMETERIVEKRVEKPKINGDMDDLLKQVYNIALSEMLGKAFGWFWNLPSYTDLGITIMYSLFEFDWDPWVSYPAGFPDHLAVIDGDMNDRFQGADVVGYFGLGDGYWLVPKENRSWKELYFNPYSGSDNFSEIRFSGFLYDDHDLSAESAIKSQVLEQGGSVLGSSGVIHDPYSAVSSSFFFSSLASGKSLGESYMDMANSFTNGSWMALMYPSASFVKTPVLYLKDVLERILFADPAYKPIDVPVKPIIENAAFSVSPSGSFLMATEIESNYTIIDGKLKVVNADSYIIDQERPVIPVFVREFILPTGASLESVNVKANYSRQHGLERDMVYNDSHYTNYTALIMGCMHNGIGPVNAEPSERDEKRIMECVREKAEPAMNYPYPKESHWYVSSRLLDGRTKISVYVPALLYENAFAAKVLENAEVLVEHDSQVELNVVPENILLGSDENLEITLLNHGDEVSGGLYLWIEGINGQMWNFNESVSAASNSSIVKTFSFRPESKGTYSVKVLFDSGNVTIGPRISTFEVGEISFSLGKKFVPEQVKFEMKKYAPAVNFPEIRVKNNGSTDIEAVNITDSIPEGFSVISYNHFNSLKKIEVENELFDTDDKIPVFVFISRDAAKFHEKKWRSPQFTRKIVMLGRKYYNASVTGNKLTITTAELAKSNLGENLGPDDTLVVKYVMTSEKINSPANLTTETIATAFYGDAHFEQSILSSLKVR